MSSRATNTSEPIARLVVAMPRIRVDIVFAGNVRRYICSVRRAQAMITFAGSGVVTRSMWAAHSSAAYASTRLDSRASSRPVTEPLAAVEDQPTFPFAASLRLEKVAAVWRAVWSLKSFGTPASSAPASP